MGFFLTMRSKIVATRYEYYKARVREHRRLAAQAMHPEDRAMHEQLVKAYTGLAREHRLRQVFTLKVARDMPRASVA